MMTELGAKDERSKMLRTHCQTSGVSLTEQDPYNNAVRTAYEAMAATLGGTQSLHTNAFDEAIALPTEESARLARNTQLILQHETGVTRTVDPLAGSYYVESLTADIAAKAQELIDEIEDSGGMTRAVAAGLPKQRIEEAATRRQARVDSAEDVIVGVNKYRLEDEPTITVLEVDNDKVRRSQINRLAQVKRERNGTQCEQALNILTDAAHAGSGNLLEFAIDAVRHRATLGEVSDAMEKAFGRHHATTTLVTGVYERARDDAPEYQLLKRRIEDFEKAQQRLPHILVAKMGQDGHDRGAKVIASSFADIGFKVDMSDLFLTPDEVAVLCINNNVDVVGVSSLAGGHKTLIPQLVSALAANNRADIKVVCGGVIPEQDYEMLRDAGVAEIFGPGTRIEDSANAIISQILGERRNR
jgi:methylmalonyl-CoA mutase